MMSVIHMQGVSPLLRGGRLNGSVCKGCENGVSTEQSWDMLNCLKEELECCSASSALDYTSLRDYIYIFLELILIEHLTS